MTIRTMQNCLKLLVAAPVIWLAACDNADLSGTSTSPNYEEYIQEALRAETKIKFQLQGANAAVDPPSFLLVDTTTGRLNLPTSDPSLSNPFAAINTGDGWGNTTPIVINFEGKPLDGTPASVVNSFHMIKIDDPLTTPSDRQDPLPLTPSYDPSTLDPDADFVVFVSPTAPNALTVLLTKPLDPSSSYMFAITDQLKDTDNNSVGFTDSYAVLKTRDPVKVESLQPAQQIVQLADELLSRVGVNSERIVYSTWFTTSSAGDVTYGTKGITGEAIVQISEGGSAADAWRGTANPKNLDLTGLYNMETVDVFDLDGIQFSTGTISIPVFLNQEVENSAWMKTPWAAGMPSIAVLLNALNTGSTADQQTLSRQLIELDTSAEEVKAAQTDPAAQARVVRALVGAKLTLADGSQLDPDRVINKFAPVPQVRYQKTIPYLMAIPNIATCPERMPVIIYAHGITLSKITLFPLAPGLIRGNCVAVIAIDLPLHGDRFIQDGDKKIVTTPENPGVFLNLQYLPVGRDNLRQAIVDQLSLRVGLGFQVSLNLDNDNPRDIDSQNPLTRLTTVGPLGNGVAFVGHSLGAMVGIGYSAISNRPVSENPASEILFFNNTRSLFANPGGDIGYFLTGSSRFGNFLRDGVLDGQSAGYRAYKAQNCTPDDISGEMCFEMFWATLPSEQQAAINVLFNQFAFAAQTVLSPADPVNLIEQIPSDTPAFMMMVRNDTTIPNRLTLGLDAVYSAVAGTLPMIWNTPLMQRESSVINPSRDAALFREGEHGSFIGGSPEAVTTEMHTQANSYLGLGPITVTAPELLEKIPQQ
ncbi:Lysophospholipase VolA [BD1-7 clade bacterium]|uniref:Lysophospholipase VolA n=1 Tax=BD1-7 clade bacterium TaxID=2029982 RepID=A0A5S9QQB2_9GAMM|nr:Lysophospholipase VolA [BD1-7 clade bacterium]